MNKEAAAAEDLGAVYSIRNAPGGAPPTEATDWTAWKVMLVIDTFDRCL